MFSFSEEEGNEPEEQARHVRPSWIGPPEDELGVAVPLHRVIGRSETAVVALSHALAHSTGISFEFRAIARGLKRSETQRIFHEQHVFDPEGLSDAFLRMGFELPGGALVSNLGGFRGRHRAFTPDEPPEGPLLFPHGGGGGSSDDRTVVMRPGYWLWPLPEPGRVKVSCEWPIVGIPLTTIEFDGSALVEAAARTVPLWTEPRDS